jgi:hypothetical protein
MAKGRMLRKKISVSEQVNDLSLKAALIFTWMISHTDDFGRLLGNARKVKGIVAPLRDDISVADVEKSLQEMHDKGLIIRYKFNNDYYIQFPEFESHQIGLNKRTKSDYPSPEDSGKFLEIPGNSKNFLPELEQELELEEELKKENDKKKKTISCPHEKIIDLYHKILPMGVSIHSDTWTKTRRAHLQARWNENSERQNLAWWEGFFKYISDSKFLTGRVSNREKAPFKISLGWIVKPENFAKIKEGNFENR